MFTRDTSRILTKLRGLLTQSELQAYIIPSTDAHNSEYLAEVDKRRQFVSGFSGSAGTAVVTLSKALLWTDGRYHLQAKQELDANWELMKDGLPETPSISDWLVNNLPNPCSVGIDSRLYDEDSYLTLNTKLNQNRIELVHTKQNLVDLAWNQEEDKPVLNKEPLVKIDLKYTGLSFKNKVKLIREQLKSLSLESTVISSLDEIAWLLNLRGHDIPFGAVFFSYLIITSNKVKLFTDLNRLSDNLKFDLVEQDSGFEFYNYEDFYTHFELYVHTDLVNSNKKIFLSSSSNHFIHSLVPNDLIYKDLSIISKLKIYKNINEIESAKRVHLRDSVVLTEFLYKLDKHFKNEKNCFQDLQILNEFTLAQYLDDMRAKQENFFSCSFDTICSYGSNGAIIHYKPKKDSPNTRVIEKNNILLIDSGAHYTDMGTTDVTRTVYLGDPSTITQYHKECFTRVLKGHIQLASRVFPVGTRTELLDSFARQALWQVGLDYRHGTGHGVGALLNVHEIPIIANRKMVEIGVKENMILTIEPGYYEDGNFGIRIENCERTVKAETKYKYASNVDFIKFEPLTYVPIQIDLIDRDILNQDEIAYLNQYHKDCLELLGNQFKSANKIEVYQWLIQQTKSI